MSNTVEKKCARDGCEKKLHSIKVEYCKAHVPHHYKLNDCKWGGCVRKCRKEYCHLHNPSYLQKKNAREREARAAKAIKAT